MRAHALPQAEAVEDVTLTFYEGTPAETAISLARIVERTTTMMPAARGSGSMVWRFQPSRGGKAIGGDTVGFALKRCSAAPVSGLPSPPHEFGYLSRLSSPLFPRGIGHGIAENGDYILVSEWIDGRKLARDSLAILTDALQQGTYEAFCRDLLEILRLLRAAGIEHSDIWEPNIIVRDGRPVLIDFGWAHELGEAPLSPTLHQPNDTLAIDQMLKRLGALHSMLLLESQIAGRTADARG